MTAIRYTITWTMFVAFMVRPVPLSAQSFNGAITGTVHDSSGARRVSYSIDERPGCVLVTVAGQIDHENCPGVCDAVCVAGEFATSVVLELSEAHFGDDAAVGLLLDTLRASAEANRQPMPS